MSSTRWLYAWGLGAIAFGGASLLLPLYIIELGAEPFTLGVLAALAALAGAPGAFLIGIIADRTGRRRIFVLGALLAYRLRHLSEADDSSSPNHNSRDSTASTVTSPRESTSD